MFYNQAHGRHSTFDGIFLAPFVFFSFIPVSNSLVHRSVPSLGVQDSSGSQSMVWRLVGVPETLLGGP